MSEDLTFFIVGAVITGVLTGLLVFGRRMVASQQWKDVLGISACFVVLAGVGWVMIVGEHALG